MKTTFLQIAICILIYSVIAFLSYSTSTRNNFEKQIIKLPKTYLVVGITSTFFFLATSIVLSVLNNNPLSWVTFSFSVLSVLLIFAYFQCRAFYDEEKVIVQNFFGKKKTVFYFDISNIKNGVDIVLETKNGVSIRFPNYMSGIFDFLMTLSRNLQKETCIKAKKIAGNPFVRAFRDSVWRSGEFVFVYILMYVCGAVFTIFCISIPKLRPALVASIVFLIVWTLCTFLSIHSAKRAHSSAFWRRVAKFFFKEEYLNL